MLGTIKKVFPNSLYFLGFLELVRIFLKDGLFCYHVGKFVLLELLVGICYLGSNKCRVEEAAGVAVVGVKECHFILTLCWFGILRLNFLLCNGVEQQLARLHPQVFYCFTNYHAAFRNFWFCLLDVDSYAWWGNNFNLPLGNRVIKKYFVIPLRTRRHRALTAFAAGLALGHFILHILLGHAWISISHLFAFSAGYFKLFCFLCFLRLLFWGYAGRVFFIMGWIDPIRTRLSLLLIQVTKQIFSLFKLPEILSFLYRRAYCKLLTTQIQCCLHLYLFAFCRLLFFKCSLSPFAYLWSFWLLSKWWITDFVVYYFHSL